MTSEYFMKRKINVFDHVFSMDVPTVRKRTGERKSNARACNADVSIKREKEKKIFLATMAVSSNTVPDCR